MTRALIFNEGQEERLSGNQRHPRQSHAKQPPSCASKSVSHIIALLYCGVCFSLCVALLHGLQLLIRFLECVGHDDGGAFGRVVV